LKINKAIEVIAELSIDRASQALSKMVKAGARIEVQRAFISDISQVTEAMNRENRSVVGSVVDLTGDAPFKFLFFVTLADSLVLTDRILQRPVGSTKEFDIYAQSAVQEIGNILASAIANVFSSDLQIAMKPTPPIVVHDFTGAIFQEFIRGIAANQNELFTIESKLCIVKNHILCSMYILPAVEGEKVLSYMSKKI
jgi:chemotaxis protein CheC